MNRNKLGVTINFRHPRGLELLRDLVRKADVLVENFRAGTMDKMGCGYDVLKAINPRLIMVSISGYGQDDDRRASEQAGFDHHLVKPVDIDQLRELLRN